MTRNGSGTRVVQTGEKVRVTPNEMAANPPAGGRVGAKVQEPTKSKREKWEWAPLPSQGGFNWVPKGDLYVDMTYQRHAKHRKVLEIAQTWDWMRAAVLVVVRRPDGLLYVVDGQHRAMAAAKRDDITHLPCLIFDAKDLSEEATAFYKINTTRSAVPIMDQYRARVIAEEPDAVGTEELFTRLGIRVAPGGGGRGTIQAVRLVMRMVREDKELAGEVLALGKEIADDDSISGHLLAALWWIAQRDRTVLKKPHATKLVQIGQVVLTTEIARHRAIVGKGGEAMDARPIVALLNKGMRGNKLVVEGGRWPGKETQPPTET